jgi:hypothetical protein
MSPSGGSATILPVWGLRFNVRDDGVGQPTASGGDSSLTPRLRGSKWRPLPLSRSELAGAYLPIDSPMPLRQMRCRAATGFVEPWAVTGSNRRPPACKAGALPAELTARSMEDSRLTQREDRPKAVVSRCG